MLRRDVLRVMISPEPSEISFGYLALIYQIHLFDWESTFQIFHETCSNKGIDQ